MNHPFSLILIICGFFLLFFPGVCSGEQVDAGNQSTIVFRLVDIGDNSIDRVSLMKSGESSKDGMTRQEQNIVFDREANEIVWTPCNDNSCRYLSSSTAGGKTGRDELILKIFQSNPAVDVASCHGDETCERLKGGTAVKSGLIDGYFRTGKIYEVSLASLQPGIGESFQVIETTG